MFRKRGRLLLPGSLQQRVHAVGVPCEVATRRRNVATALLLAGIGALARVRAAVHHEIAASRRSVATALHLAGIRCLLYTSPSPRD